jgi:hypothetical protein
MKRSVTHVQLSFSERQWFRKGRVSDENAEKVYEYQLIRSVTDVLLRIFPIEKVRKECVLYENFEEIYE